MSSRYGSRREFSDRDSESERSRKNKHEYSDRDRKGLYYDDADRRSHDKMRRSHDDSKYRRTSLDDPHTSKVDSRRYDELRESSFREKYSSSEQDMGEAERKRLLKKLLDRRRDLLEDKQHLSEKPSLREGRQLLAEESHMRSFKKDEDDLKILNAQGEVESVNVKELTKFLKIKQIMAAQKETDSKTPFGNARSLDQSLTGLSGSQSVAGVSGARTFSGLADTQSLAGSSFSTSQRSLGKQNVLYESRNAGELYQENLGAPGPYMPLVYQENLNTTQNLQGDLNASGLFQQTMNAPVPNQGNWHGFGPHQGNWTGPRNLQGQQLIQGNLFIPGPNRSNLHAPGPNRGGFYSHGYNQQNLRGSGPNRGNLRGFGPNRGNLRGRGANRGNKKAVPEKRTLRALRQILHDGDKEEIKKARDTLIKEQARKKSNKTLKRALERVTAKLRVIAPEEAYGGAARKKSNKTAKGKSTDKSVTQTSREALTKSQNNHLQRGGKPQNELGTSFTMPIAVPNIDIPDPVLIKSKLESLKKIAEVAEVFYCRICEVDTNNAEIHWIHKDTAEHKKNVKKIVQSIENAIKVTFTKAQVDSIGMEEGGVKCQFCPECRLPITEATGHKGKTSHINMVNYLKLLCDICGYTVDDFEKLEKHEFSDDHTLNVKNHLIMNGKLDDVELPKQFMPDMHIGNQYLLTKYGHECTVCPQALKLKTDGEHSKSELHYTNVKNFMSKKQEKKKEEENKEKGEANEFEEMEEGVDKEEKDVEMSNEDKNMDDKNEEEEVEKMNSEDDNVY